MRRLAVVLFIVGLILVTLGIVLENPNCPVDPENVPQPDPGLTPEQVYQQMQYNVPVADPTQLPGSSSSYPSLIPNLSDQPYQSPSVAETSYPGIYTEMEVNPDYSSEHDPESIDDEIPPHQSMVLNEDSTLHDTPDVDDEQGNTIGERDSHISHDGYPYLKADRTTLQSRPSTGTSVPPATTVGHTGQSIPTKLSNTIGHRLKHNHYISPIQTHPDYGGFTPEKSSNPQMGPPPSYHNKPTPTLSHQDILNQHKSNPVANPSTDPKPAPAAAPQPPTAHPSATTNPQPSTTTGYSSLFGPSSSLSKFFSPSLLSSLSHATPTYK
jgi:hypothetical protein